MHNLIEFARAVLSTTPARWIDLTEKVPVALLSRPPLPGEWSALQCLQHLIDGETFVFPVRVQAFLAGEKIADFNPDTTELKTKRNETPAQLASRFSRLRMANLRLLDKVSAADLKRSSVHSALGKVTLSQMLHEWAGHDLMHTVQAERAIMQPFIEGSGPWRTYFSDHDAKAKTRS